MTAEQECALRVAKELIKTAVKTLESAFPKDGEVCLACVAALDGIDRRLRLVGVQ